MLSLLYGHLASAGLLNEIKLYCTGSINSVCAQPVRSESCGTTLHYYTVISKVLGAFLLAVCKVKGKSAVNMLKRTFLQTIYELEKNRGDSE